MAEKPPLRVTVTSEDVKRAQEEEAILKDDQPPSPPAPEAEPVAPEPVQLVDETAPAGELVVEDQAPAEQPAPEPVAEQPVPENVAQPVLSMNMENLATAGVDVPESKGPAGIPAVQVQDILPSVVSERAPELEREDLVVQEMTPVFLKDKFKDIGGGLFRVEIGNQQITLTENNVAKVKAYFALKEMGEDPSPAQVEAFEIARARVMRSRDPDGKEVLGVQLPYADYSNTATVDENEQEYTAYREAKITVEKAESIGINDPYALKALRDSTPLGVGNTFLTSLQTTPYATARFFTEAGNWVIEATADLAQNGINGFWNRMGNSAEGRARDINQLFETLRADYLPNYRDIKNRQIRDRFVADRTEELLEEGYDEAEVDSLVQEELKTKANEPGFYLDDKQADEMYKFELSEEAFLGNFARVLYEDVGIGLGFGLATNLTRRSAKVYEESIIRTLTDAKFDDSGVIKFRFTNMSIPEIARMIELDKARKSLVHSIVSRISLRGSRLKSQAAQFEQVEKGVKKFNPDIAKRLKDIDEEMDGLGLDLLRARLNDAPELAQIEARIKNLANDKVKTILAANKGALPPAFVAEVMRDASGAAMGYAIGSEVASYFFGTDDAELGGIIGAVAGGAGLTRYIGSKSMRIGQSTRALPSVLGVPGRGLMAVEELADFLTGKTADFLEKRGFALSAFFRNPIIPRRVKDPDTGVMRRPTAEEKRYFERLNRNFMKVDDRIMEQYLPRLTAYQEAYRDIVKNMSPELRDEVSDLLAISLIDRMEFTGLQAAYASATSTIRYQDVFKAGKTLQELSLAIVEQEQKAQRLAGVNERLSKLLAGELGDLPPSVREQLESILISGDNAVDAMAKEASQARTEVNQIQKALLKRLGEPDALSMTTPKELEDIMLRIIESDKIINGEDIYKTVEGARARLATLFNQVANNRAEMLTSEGNVLNLGEPTTAKRLEAEEKIAAGAEQLLQLRQQQLVEEGVKIYEPIRGENAPVLDATSVLRSLIEQFGEEELATLKFFSDSSIITTTVPGRQLIRDLNTNAFKTLMESAFVKNLVERQVKQGGPADPEIALEEQFFSDRRIKGLLLEQEGSGWDGRQETLNDAYTRINYAQKLHFIREIFPLTDDAKKLFQEEAEYIKLMMPTFDLEAGALENVRQFASNKASRSTDPMVKTRMNGILDLVDNMYKDAGDIELPDGSVGNLFDFIQNIRKDYQFRVGIPTAKGGMLERFESALQERPMRPDLGRPIYKDSSNVMSISLGGSIRDIFLSDNPAEEASNFLAMFRQLYGNPKKLPGYEEAVSRGASEAELSKYVTYELDPNSDEFKEILPQIQAIATVGYLDAAGMKYVLRESGEIITTPKVFGDNPFSVSAKRGVELLDDKETLAEAQKRLMIPGTDIPLVDLNKLVEARNQYILRMDTSEIKRQYENLKSTIEDLFKENQEIAQDIEKNRILSKNDRSALLAISQNTKVEDFFKNVIDNPAVGVLDGPDKVKNGILAARDALAKETGDTDRANAAMAKLVLDAVLSQGKPRAADNLGIKEGKYTSTVLYDDPARIFQILEDKEGRYQLREVLTGLGMDEKKYDMFTGLMALQTVMKKAEEAGGISMTKLATTTDSSIISRAFSWWRGQIGTEFIVAQAGFQYMAERKMSFVKFMLETKDENTIDVLHQILTGTGDDLSTDDVKTFGLVMWSHILRETQEDPEVIVDTLDGIKEGTYNVGVGLAGAIIED